MEATASTSVAVASSSTANNTNNMTTFPNHKTNTHHTTHSLIDQNIPPLGCPITTHDLTTTTTVPHNRAIVCIPNFIKFPVATRPSNSVVDNVNVTPFSLNRSINSIPESKNYTRNQPQNLTDPNAGRISSPRCPRREQLVQDPRTQTVQNARNRQNAQTAPPPPEPHCSKVLVTGYPLYTKPNDILEVFKKFGNVRVDECNSFSATLTYFTEQHAKNAIAANKRLHIYGHFLSVKPLTEKAYALKEPMSPKREFPQSMIIDPDYIDLSGDFNSQLDKIMAAIRLNQDDINKISTVYKDLEHALQVQWPGCKAIPFGSITTGLGIKTSDADCFMSLPQEFRSTGGHHVNCAERLLTLQPHLFDDILAIPRANTPIVKFYHVPTGTDCDLTFKTPLGVQNSRLVAFLLDADSRILPLAVLIKYWAKVHALSGTGRLTNYALTWMIFFYLQQPPLRLLPSVFALQRDRANDVIVDRWNTGFALDSDAIPKSKDKSTIAELVGGFFEYYANFDFDELIICPYLGTPIKKSTFAVTASLIHEFSQYWTNVRYKYVLPLRHLRPFCVQDPFEQCRNVASIVNYNLALEIRRSFESAAAAYEREKANNCAGFLKILLEKPKVLQKQKLFQKQKLREKPKLVRGMTYPEYRVNLFPRLLNTISSFDWTSVVINLILTIFEKMIKIKLGKVEEKMNPDSKREKAKYTGSVTKPIWKRKKYDCLDFPPDLGFEETETLISEELIKNEVEKVSLDFQLTFSFCHQPKSVAVSIRMNSGEMIDYREFGRFFLLIMHNWFMRLLKPFCAPIGKDAAAKVAKAADDDDDREIVLAPSTNRAQAQE